MCICTPKAIDISLPLLYFYSMRTMTLFGPAHLLWLAILVAILAVVMRVFSAAKTEMARRRLLLAAAWAVIITHFAESFTASSPTELRLIPEQKIWLSLPLW